MAENALYPRCATQRNAMSICKHEWSTYTQNLPLDAERIGCMLLLFFCLNFEAGFNAKEEDLQRSSRKGKTVER